jgi:hypothetical protein
VRCEDAGGLLDLLIVQVEHVDVPGTAELDVLNAQFVQDNALFFQIGVDLVGESRQCPHD